MESKTNKKFSFWFWFVVIFTIFFAVFSVNKTIQIEKNISRLKEEHRMYQEQLEESKRDKEDIKNQLNKSTNPEYIEDVARNKLDMFLPNETVYVLGE